MSVVRARRRVDAAPRRGPLLMSSAVVPPTSGVNTSLDSPKVPWHEAHLASHTSCALRHAARARGQALEVGAHVDVPGRDFRGRRGAADAGILGRPAPRRRQRQPAAQASERRRSVNLDIAHLPALRHLPRLDRVVVIDRARAAHRAQLVDLRLHVAGLVDRADLQDRRARRPTPSRC